MHYSKIRKDYCPFCLQITNQSFVKREPATENAQEIIHVNLLDIYIDIVRCNQCSSVFVCRNIPLSVIERYYKDDPRTKNPTNKRTFHWHLNHQLISINAILRYINNEPRSPLLDVGCGMGILLYLAKEKSWPVIGLEINPILSNFVSNELGIGCINDTFLNAKLPFNYYGVIVLCDVLEHLFEPLIALKRCFELLKPGGLIVIKVPHWKIQYLKELLKHLVGIGSGNIATMGHLNQFDPESLRLACQRAGFLPMKVYPAQSNLPVLGEEVTFDNLKNSFTFALVSASNVLFDAFFKLSNINLSPNIIGLARKPYDT